MDESKKFVAVLLQLGGCALGIIAIMEIVLVPVEVNQVWGIESYSLAVLFVLYLAAVCTIGLFGTMLIDWVDENRYR